jgi:LmeA-like phospholipid-binding
MGEWTTGDENAAPGRPASGIPDQAPTRPLPLGKPAWPGWDAPAGPAPVSLADAPGPQDPPVPPAAAGGRRRFRRRRVALLVIVILIILLGVADRVAARIAPAEMVAQIQKTDHLPSKPQASIGGVPFLTQVVFGKYTDVGITIHRIGADNICVDQVSAHLKGVHVPLTKAISGKVTTVPIDEVDGSVRLTYADLNKYLATQPGHVTLSPAGSALRVASSVDIPIIGPVSVFGAVRVAVANDRFTISPASIGVGGLGSLTVPAAAGRALTVTVPISGLPLNLHVVSATTSSTGISLSAKAAHLTVKNSKPTTPIRGC